MTNLDTSKPPVAGGAIPLPGGEALAQCMNFVVGNGVAPAFCLITIEQIDTDNDGKKDSLRSIVIVKIPDEE